MIVLPVSRSPLNIASMASRRRASANFLSLFTCCSTKSLKLFVLAISPLPSTPPAFALLVVLPVGVSRVDVPLLPLLRAACQQDYACLSVLPEIHAVPRAKIDAAIKHPLADRFHRREVALLQSDNGTGDLGLRN